MKHSKNNKKKAGFTSTDRKSQKNNKSTQSAGHRSPTGDWPDLIYGKNALTEVLRAGNRKILELMTADPISKFLESPLGKLAKQKGHKVLDTNMQELNRLSQGGVHQNVLARVERYPTYPFSDILKSKDSKRLILALDCVQDPQNFGTLCRSALAFGVKEIIIPQDRSVSITGTVCKTSAGAVEHLKVIQVTNLVRALQELKKNEFWIYGASLDSKSVGLQQCDPGHKSVLVLGSEGKGLRRLVADTCDQLVKIEMVGDFDSLNVAQAGTVMIYDFINKIMPD